MRIVPFKRILNSGLPFLILIFGFWIYSYAAPCYGTKMPRKNKFFLGLQSHSLFKRYLENQAGKLRSSQEFLLLSYGLYDWLAVDLQGGAGYIKQRPAGSDETDYPSYLGGGYGFRLRLYDKENIKMVFGFQHISVHPKTVYLGNVKHKAVLDDWQFSALVSYAFKKIAPYLGTRWSRVDYIHWTDGERNRVRSDPARSWGIICGFDLPITEKTWINLEGSAFDSEALAFSINHKW